jgi:hypothetical protein
MLLKTSRERSSSSVKQFIKHLLAPNSQSSLTVLYI